MKHNNIQVLTQVTLFLICAVILVGYFPANAGVMNYQGLLTDGGGVPLTGTYSLQFTIYADAGGASSLWSETQPAVSVNNGLFNVQLGTVTTIPASIFNGDSRWLGIKVDADPEIAPLTLLSSAPGAFHASSVDGYSSGPKNEISGLWSSAAGDSNTINADYSTVAGGQANVIIVSEIADTILDTTDIFNNPGMLYTSYENERSPETLGPFSFIGGGLSNHAHCSFVGIVSGFSNQANGHFSFVGGGYTNQIGDSPTGCVCGNFSVIGGGALNRLSGHFGTIGGGLTNRILNCSIAATIGGGRWNQTNSNVSTVGGGFRNFANGFATTVSGGEGNSANSEYATVSGGQANTAILNYATVGGGQSNIAEAEYSTIAGGGLQDPTNPLTNNVVYDMYGTIGGGGDNKVGTDNGITSDMPYGFIGGGESNTVLLTHGVIGGGKSNMVDGVYNAIGGGESNTTGNSHATIGGGFGNNVLGDSSVIAGGASNSANGFSSAIGGGQQNLINFGADRSVIAGGENNFGNGPNGAIGGGAGNITGQGMYATVPGGFQNEAIGRSCFAAGQNAKAFDDCSFVWSDCCLNADGTVGGPYLSNGANTFNARAQGGIYFQTSCDAAGTTPVGVYVPAGGGAWLTLSDVNSKKIHGNIDGSALLAQIDKLQISRWSYKTQDETIQHIGPTAQDFYKLFGVGDNNLSIATVDPDGIALAAIKALHAENKELKSELAEIKALLLKLTADN